MKFHRFDDFALDKYGFNKKTCYLAKKMTLIILIAILVWGYFYIKFRRKYKYFTVMVEYLNEEIKQTDYEKQAKMRLMLSLSSALIEIQHYKDAYNIYVQAEQNPLLRLDIDKIRINKAFCVKPYPGCNGPKNLNHSYWHNFLLLRLGGRRYNFLTSEIFTKTNLIMRKSH